MDYTTDNQANIPEVDACEDEATPEPRKPAARSAKGPTKWKRRRRPPRRNRKPSRPDNHIGLRNNGRFKRF